LEEKNNTSESQSSSFTIVIQTLILIVVFGIIGVIVGVFESAYDSLIGYGLVGVVVGLGLAMVNILRQK